MKKIWMKFKDMSKRQRNLYLMQNVRFPTQVHQYIDGQRTNRCLEFRFEFDQMVAGKMTVSIERIQQLVNDIEMERKFREVHYGN